MKHETFVRLQSPAQLIRLLVFGRRGRHALYRTDLELVRNTWMSMTVQERAVMSGHIASRRRGRNS